MLGLIDEARRTLRSPHFWFGVGCGGLKAIFIVAVFATGYWLGVLT